MEQLIGLVVFAILGAITLYGFVSSNRASRTPGRTDQNRPMAGVSAE